MKNFGLLILISAIWSSSYIFMKVLSPVYGGFFVAFSRMFIGGTFSIIYAKIVGVKFDFKNNTKHYIVIALLNSALPLTCFSIAALYIDASLSVVINSLSSVFASMYGIYFLKEKITMKQAFGLTIAFTSVVYMSMLKDSAGSSQTLGIVLAFVATNCYALSSIYITLKAKHVDARASASVATLIGSMMIFPIALFTLQSTEINYIFEFLFLGILCTGVAYIIYFYLIKQIGVKALATTFIQPAFGSIWAVIFLGETLTIKMIITTCTIIFGVYIFLSDKIKDAS